MGIKKCMIHKYPFSACFINTELSCINFVCLFFQVAVVLNKTDCVLSRASNELLNAMRFDELKEYAPQQLTTFEVSALAGKGLRPLLEWIKGTKPKPK